MGQETVGGPGSSNRTTKLVHLWFCFAIWTIWSERGGNRSTSFTANCNQVIKVRGDKSMDYCFVSDQNSFNGFG